MKEGYRTTEFWIGVLTQGGMLIVALGFNLDVEEMVAVMAPAVAYILSRGWAKSAPVVPPEALRR